MTVQTHEGTIPSLPELGKALAKLNISVPAPKLGYPEDPDPGDGDGDGESDGDDNRPRFIKEATVSKRLLAYIAMDC